MPIPPPSQLQLPLPHHHHHQHHQYLPQRVAQLASDAAARANAALGGGKDGGVAPVLKQGRAMLGRGVEGAAAATAALALSLGGGGAHAAGVRGEAPDYGGARGYTAEERRRQEAKDAGEGKSSSVDTELRYLVAFAGRRHSEGIAGVGSATAGSEEDAGQDGERHRTLVKEQERSMSMRRRKGRQTK